MIMKILKKGSSREEGGREETKSMPHAPVKIICQFHAHSVHQNSVEIFWAKIYRGRLL